MAGHAPTGTGMADEERHHQVCGETSLPRCQSRTTRARTRPDRHGEPRALEIYGDPQMPDRWLLGTLTHHVVRVGLPIGAATGLWAVCKHLGNKTADAVYESNTDAMHFLFERIAHYVGPLFIPAATLASI